MFRFGNSQLWTAHFGGFDQSLVLENDFDACDGFDDRFAENQLFYRFELFLDRGGFVEFARATGDIQGGPFFGRDVGDADERAIGAELVTFGDKAVVAGEHPHRGFVALECLNGFA